MNIKEYDWSSILDGLGMVATVFNPVIGRGLIVASQVADKLDDDDILENNVIGLTRSSEIIDLMIEKNEVDFEQLVLISENLKSLEDLLTKMYKGIK